MNALLILALTIASFFGIGYVMAKIRVANTSRRCLNIGSWCLAAAVAFSFFKMLIAIVYLFAAITQIHLGYRYRKLEAQRRMLESIKNNDTNLIA